MGTGADHDSDRNAPPGPARVTSSGSLDDPAPQDHDASVDEPSASLAWRAITSPRTFFVLSAMLATLFVLASTVPQRALPGELARALPFATAEAARDLGLVDLLGSWPLLLAGLLLGLNVLGLLVMAHLRRNAPTSPVASARLLFGAASATIAAPPDALRARLPEALGTPRLVLSQVPGPAPRLIATRGLVREGLLLAVFGALTLLAALVVHRGAALDARMTLVPGSPALSETTVRDGEHFLLRQLPFGLLCQRPDPQDRRRTFPCRAAVQGASSSAGPAGSPTDLPLTPGRSSSLGAFELSLQRETLRTPRESDPLELVIRRGATLERLRVEPGKTLELTSGGERVTAFHGPDGPLIVLQTPPPARAAPDSPEPRAAPHKSATLLVPSAPSAVNPQAPIVVEVEHQTQLSAIATTSPERPLVLAGIVLLILGLLLAALVPHLRIELAPAASGATLVSVTSLNRAALPPRALAILEQRPSEPASPAPLATLLAQLRARPLQVALPLALAAGGLALGWLNAATGPALALVIATLPALGTGAAPPLGALALIAGLGTAPSPSPLTAPWALALLTGGLALGLVSRWLATDGTLRRNPIMLSGLLALLLAFLLSLPTPTLALAGPDGSPLQVAAALVDGPSEVLAHWPVAAHLPGVRPPLAGLTMVAAWLAAFVLLAAHLRSTAPTAPAAATARTPREPGLGQRLWSTSNAARLGLAVAGLGVFVAIFSFAGLFESVSLDPEALRRQLDLAASRDASVLSVSGLEAALLPWSRPFVDGLVLLLSGALAVRLLPLASPVSAPAPVAHPEPPPQAATPILLALASAALAAFFSAIARPQLGGVTFVALAAVLLLAAVLVLARSARPAADAQVSPAPLLTRFAAVGAALALAGMWLVWPLFTA